MRSVLQEAPSISKAIEKAWNEAGRPQEFSIKIFDAGEKNFLGFSRRPAVVSIMFDPRKSTPAAEAEGAAQARRESIYKNHGPIQPGYAKRQRSEAHNRTQSYPDRESKTSEEPVRRERPYQRSYNNNNQRSNTHHAIPEPVSNQSSHPVAEKPHSAFDADQRRQNYIDNYVWSADAVEDIKGWLGHLTSIMKISNNFAVQADNHLLRIDFERPVFDMASEERMLFSSFAYILMQFLKRKHKKKFKGCRLAISSRR